VTDETTSAVAATVPATGGSAATDAAAAESAVRGSAVLGPAAGGPAAGKATAMTVPSAGTQDQVTIRMPADGAYLSVLRTATAGLAARLDFTLDDIEDLRIAVDEACAMLLAQAIPGSSLECSFALEGDGMAISVSVPCLNPRPPSADTFAWTVLSALAGKVEAQAGPGDRLAIVMRKSRPDSGSA
jgi:serine/threonine-protein kinase RsbW